MAGVSQWQEHAEAGYVDGDAVRYSRPKLVIVGIQIFGRQIFPISR